MVVKTASEAETGESATNQRLITYAEAGVEAISEEMRRDPTIFYMGQGVGPRGGNFQQSRGLWTEFGGTRVRDTPIAERGQTGLGIGAALAGSHPIGNGCPQLYALSPRHLPLFIFLFSLSSFHSPTIPARDRL